MHNREVKQGRTVVQRLTDGGVVHEVIEGFAQEKGITGAALAVHGGAWRGSQLVVGPEITDGRPVSPMTHALSGVHEVTGTGTLAAHGRFRSPRAAARLSSLP
jgi:predicted DNA-binding protein with PD1-like motif